MTIVRRIFLLSLVLVFIGSLDCLLAQSAIPNRYWVFLNQRSVTNATPQALGISERALKRRAKVLPPDKIIDRLDYPIPQSMIDQIQATGATIRTMSRWLNAVAVEMSASQLESVSTLPFIQRIAPVSVLRLPKPTLAKVARSLAKSQSITSIDYGPSLTQLATEHIPDVHALGIIGSGVVVGMIDDGFNNHRTHVALKNINVLAEYDFIHNIPDTQLQPWESPDQGIHGAGTLSSVAGFDPGNIVGGAFGVSVLLAKTEMDSSGNADFRSEEDTYVAGLEWMERMGADIASSSLAYKEFVPPDTNYSYSSLNGHTTLVAKAATIAAQKGVLLCTAMGNEGLTNRDTSGNLIYSPGTLWSPADADSILAVGATSSSGKLAGFSGTGPTSDGRIKPDIVAQGTAVYWALGSTTDSYWSVQGTSCSTPIVASIAALVFSAHPDWTPMQVRQAIIQTAEPFNDGTSQTAAYPNSFYGYGIANALNAVLSNGLVFSNRPIITVSDSSAIVTMWVRSTSSLIPDSLAFYYCRSSDAVFVRVPLVSTADNNFQYQYSARIPAALLADSIVGYFSATDGVGTRRNPFNAPANLISIVRTPDSVVSLFPPVKVVSPPSDYVLYQNFPNPFNPGTTIRFYAPRAEHVELTIYNLLGQHVRTLFNGTTVPGANNQFRWNDARDDFGRTVSSGVYFFRLKTPGYVLTNKMLYLK